MDSRLIINLSQVPCHPNIGLHFNLDPQPTFCIREKGSPFSHEQNEYFPRWVNLVNLWNGNNYPKSPFPLPSSDLSISTVFKKGGKQKNQRSLSGDVCRLWKKDETPDQLFSCLVVGNLAIAKWAVWWHFDHLVSGKFLGESDALRGPANNTVSAKWFVPQIIEEETGQAPARFRVVDESVLVLLARQWFNHMDKYFENYLTWMEENGLLNDHLPQRGRSTDDLILSNMVTHPLPPRFDETSSPWFHAVKDNLDPNF
jgi:hypothetical protein